MPRLIVKNDDEDKIFDMLEEQLTIGRAEDTTLKLEVNGLSARHCQIARADDGYQVTDLDSSYGTLVNGERVKEQFLKPGDTLRLGDAWIEFQWLPWEHRDLGSAPVAPPDREEVPDDEPDRVEVEPEPDDAEGDDSGPRPIPQAEPEPEPEAEPDAAPSDKRYRLIVISGSEDISEHEFDAKLLTIGRSSNRDVQITDEAASGKHARLIPTSKGYFIKDDSSRNGTFVHGKRVKSQLLRTGDVIQIGKTHLRFVDLGPSAAGADAAEDERKEADGGPTEATVGADTQPTQTAPRDVPTAVTVVARGRTAEEAPTDDEEDQDDKDESETEAARRTEEETERAVAPSAKAALVEEEEEEEDEDEEEEEEEEEEGEKEEEDEDEEEEEASADEGPVTRMVKRGDVGPAAAKAGTKRQREEGRDEEEDMDTAELAARAEAEEMRGSRKRPAAKPRSRSRQKAVAPVPGEGSRVPSIIASAISLAIVGGAAWFAFSGRSPDSSENSPNGKSGKGSPKALVAELPENDAAPAEPSEAQLAMSRIPLPDLPDIKSSGVDRGVDGLSADDLQFGEGEEVLHAQPLNATRRGGNYENILDDLINDVAKQAGGSLSASDLRRIDRAQEMIRDFNLSAARRELAGLKGANQESKRCEVYLKVIADVIRHTDAALAKGEQKVDLKDIAFRLQTVGQIVSVSEQGLKVKPRRGTFQSVSWSQLRPEERYMLARESLPSEDPNNHIYLGVMCTALGLYGKARKELDWAERLGFQDVERFRSLLKREPDSLR